MFNMAGAGSPTPLPSPVKMSFGWENYARADALATPGEGTRPTGVRIYHSRW